MKTANVETFVWQKAEEGLKVYAPSQPQNTYLVRGTLELPECSCPEFQERVLEDEKFRCRHILAVEGELPSSSPESDQRRCDYAGQAAMALPQPLIVQTGTQMLIKRSVSPDGKIDSLSVEFSYPIDSMTLGEIKDRAARCLALQHDIVAGFLASCRPQGQNGGGRSGANGRNGNGNSHGNGNSYGNGRSAAGQGNGAVPARMVAIRGMQTRVGWRTFIDFEVEGRTLKLFGTQKELAQAITAAGYPNLAGNIKAGVELNIPCRLTLESSDDGRYQNVSRVFPAGRMPVSQRADRWGNEGGPSDEDLPY